MRPGAARRVAVMVALVTVACAPAPAGSWRPSGAYAPRFAPGATRDSLSFLLLDVDPLAPDVANVIATYVLARRVGGRDSVTAQGETSLVVRRVNGRWRIVHDHSS